MHVMLYDTWNSNKHIIWQIDFFYVQRFLEFPEDRLLKLLCDIKSEERVTDMKHSNSQVESVILRVLK